MTKSHRIGDSNKAYVSQMFSQICGEYDRLNRIISFCLDILWRRRAASKLLSSDLVLDFCAGTGDMATALLSNRSFKGKVILCDFNQDMLEIAQAKLRRAGLLGRVFVVVSDVERLPFKSGVSDGAMMGFSLRHIEDLELFFNEIKRVLKKDQRAVLLDVAHPEVKLIRDIYFFYYDRILPKLSRMFSKGHADIYNYLPRSLKRFLRQKELLNMLSEMGFSEAAYTNVLFGAAVIYTLTK